MSPTTLSQIPVPSRKFGTFLGVYTPSVLTILGLVMYLRFGWVVGNAGLLWTLVIVLLASAISFVTALSASAIATNMRVGVGGEYYLISRSLGLELGGTIGIALFLCRTLSITFYCLGLSESVLGLALGHAPSQLHVQLVAAGIIVAVTLIAGRSATLALQLQVPILVAVGLSVLALAIGVFQGGLRAPLTVADYPTAEGGFWMVFAVFFPAVTGFAAGIGMSGDLEDPRKSIPRGTLLAVATGTAVYVVVPILLAVAVSLSPEALAEPGIAPWITTAVLGAWLIYPGLWGAILSSAIGSVLGGPRVLQALANDGLAPRLFARLSKTGQPTVATWASGGIALGAVALGGLNTVATLVTVLFLILYATINFSAVVEGLTGDPSYRPTIQVPWAVSLLGGLGSIGVMFLISPWACLAAMVLVTGVWFTLRRRALEARWGDVRAGLWLSIARWALLRLRRYRPDSRNWRPHILAFVRDPGRHLHLVRLANWFNQKRGVVTACRLIEGSLDQRIDVDAALAEIDDAIDGAKIEAFAEVDVVADFERGAIDIVQANGIAGLHSNTVLFGFPKDPERLAAQLRILRTLGTVGKGGLIARLEPGFKPKPGARIDIWWGGLENNGDLMLLFAYLLSLNTEWDGAEIWVRSIANDEDERAQLREGLTDLIPETRIHAQAEILVREPGETVANIVHRESAAADLVFLGLTMPEPGEELTYGTRLRTLADGLSSTIFVRNAGAFAGDLI
ncbi:MAG: Na-K-Cl cotransporter [Acidobacteriota bacterium]